MADHEAGALRHLCQLSVPLVAMLIGAPALSQERVSVRVESYPIEGTTTSDLIRSVVETARGPANSDHGAASTTIRFRPELGYVDGRTSCRLSDIKVYLDITVVLPRWVAPPGASEETREAWARFDAYLREHENQHISIASDFRELMETELATLAHQGTCQVLGARAIRAVAEVERLHEEAQRAFDAEERQRSLSFGR